MLSFLFRRVITCRPLCCGLRRCSIGGLMVRRMVRRMGKSFLQILGCVYSGDDLNNPIRRDGAESFATERWSDGWSDGWGSRFCKFLDVYIRGMIWIIRFGEMEQNRLRQKDGPTDGPTDGEAVFANSWMCIFGG
jgi:hypothetical protein